MRFLSLLLAGATGCALVDAAGEAESIVDYRLGNIPDLGPAPTAALVANLDNSQGKDVVVLTEHTVKACLGRAGGGFEIVDVEGGIDVIGIGNLDGTQTDEIIGAALGVLTVWTANGNGGFERRILDSVTLANAQPRTITTGNFPILDPNGRSIIVTYVDRPEVRVIGQVFGNPVVKTLTASVGNAGEAVAADVRSSPPLGDELVIVDGSGLVEYFAPDVDFQSVGRQVDGLPVHIAAGNFDSNPQVDLAYTRADPQAGITIVPGSPSGLSTLGVTFPVIGRGVTARTLMSGLFNGDTQPDLATLSELGGPREIHLFLRAGGDEFVEASIAIEDDHPVTFVSAGDLDGDGRDDFLLVPGKVGGVDLLLSR